MSFQSEAKAQQVKALAAKPDDLSLIPRTHGRRRELTPASCLLVLTGAQWRDFIHAHTMNK